MAKEKKHDVVIVGGGHNGLLVGAYLAKAGLDVCIVEAQDKLGGGVMTKELTLSGFKHDVASTQHAIIMANPVIHQDELKLISKYGLKYVNPDNQLAVIFPDDSALIFYRSLDKTCESISQFSERDAEAYRKFFEFTFKLLKVASVATFSPTPSWGSMMSFLDASEEGREYIRIILSSVIDIVDEWFESERLKVALARYASEMAIGPREKGTGNAIFFIAALHRWGWGTPIGGSGALADALEACLLDYGATIKTSSPVKFVTVEGGEAKGVVLNSGEEIKVTKAVITNVHVKQLFLEMLRPEDLPEGFQIKVKRIKPATFSIAMQHLALNEPPKYKGGNGKADTSAFVEITPFLEELYKINDGFVYGVPSTKMPTMVTATINDTTRAPVGKHTLYLGHYEPYNLKDGGTARWDHIKQQLADEILATLREHTTNMGNGNILGRLTESPLDIERRNPAMKEGDMGHIGHFLTQFFSNRPVHGFGQYRTPIKRLYMCGASTHPGLGVTGGPGRAAAQVIMEDLGIEFRKIVAK